MSGSREAAVVALETLIAGAFAWASPPSRRLKLWSDVPTNLRPCAFLFEGGNETYAWSNTAIAKRTIEVKLFIYIDAKDHSLPGSQQLNVIMEALDVAFQPCGQDTAFGRVTLGGNAYQARIDGKPLKDPGDLDGDGMLIVPITIWLP